MEGGIHPTQLSKRIVMECTEFLVTCKKSFNAIMVPLLKEINGFSTNELISVLTKKIL